KDRTGASLMFWMLRIEWVKHRARTSIPSATGRASGNGCSNDLNRWQLNTIVMAHPLLSMRTGNAFEDTLQHRPSRHNRPLPQVVRLGKCKIWVIIVHSD